MQIGFIKLRVLSHIYTYIHIYIWTLFHADINFLKIFFLFLYRYFVFNAFIAFYSVNLHILRQIKFCYTIVKTDRYDYRINYINYGPVRINYCPVRINYGPVRINYGPVRINYGPVRINYGPVRINYGPVCIN